MKRLLFFALLISLTQCLSQSYVDLVKIGYGHSFNNRFEGGNSNTNISTLEADLTLPVVLSEKHTLVTGLIFGSNQLQLFPESDYSHLYSTAVKLGLSSSWGRHWSSTLVLLPKWASDYTPVGMEDLFLGGYFSLKYSCSDRLVFRFGAYASTEAFGLFATPFFGWYYLSPNGRFEMDVSLPISADLNYDLGNVKLGMDYFGIGRSFNLKDGNPAGIPAYVDLSSLEFASYLQFDTFDDTVLIRAKFGYASSDFEVYAREDKIDLGLSAFSFGDDRQQLNPSIGGGFFVKLEAIYRFQLPNSSKDQP